MRKLIMILLALMLMTSSVFASSVTYQDDAEKFILSPGSEYSPSDLFTDFKGVMPGDSISQTIVVRNEDTPKNVIVKVYLKALGAAEGSEEFLSQMNLSVKGPEQSDLFQAPASETAQLSDWVCLGGVQAKGEIPLELTLNVPITMGNDFQNQIGYLDWQFKVERVEIPPEQYKDNSASDTQTGDESNMLPLYGICGIALVILLLLLVTRRKK